MQESRVLLNNAAVVESIFQELGPGFTTCFRYEDMEDPAQAARVARFAAPNDYIAEHLSRNMLYKVKIRSPPPQQQQVCVGGGIECVCCDIHLSVRRVFFVCPDSTWFSRFFFLYFPVWNGYSGGPRFERARTKRSTDRRENVELDRSINNDSRWNWRSATGLLLNRSRGRVTTSGS